MFLVTLRLEYVARDLVSKLSDRELSQATLLLIESCLTLPHLP